MSWLDGIRDRLDAWLRDPDARDQELREEIAHHLDIETNRLVDSGLSRSEARRTALDRFGDPEIVVHETRFERGGNLGGAHMQDLRWALRSLRRNPGFALLSLATLTLGVGATCAAFAVLNGILLKPLPYARPEQLVFLQERTPKGELNPPSHPNFVDWREQSRSFEAIASAMFPAPRTISANSSQAVPERLITMGVSRRFFATLGIRLARGREFTDAENTLGGAPVAVVSYEYWRDQMGAREPLGRITIGERPLDVVGVLPPSFTFVTPADIYLPHEQGPGTCRTCRNYMVVGRLRTGVTIAQARLDMSLLSTSLRSTYGTETNAVDVDIQPLQEHLVANHRVLLAVVFAASGLVLLIACVNLLSAQLARGWAREREVGVRAALGASGRRLFAQLITETGVLVVIGGIGGIALAVALVRLVRTLGAAVLPRVGEIAVDWRVALFAVATIGLTGLLVGVYPAWRMSRNDPARSLRGARGSSAAVRASAWRLLIGFEIAVAVILTIGSTLMVRTLHNIVTHDTGFHPAGVVTAALSPSDADAPRLEEARRALAALPAVEGVAYTTRLPLSWGSNSGPVRRPGDPLDRDWPAMAGFRVVTSDYFKVLQQPVLRGRSLAESDRAGTMPVAVITPGIAAKLWPGQDPIGKTIATNYLMGQWLTVVGVVAEASSWTMQSGAQNEIFVPLAQQERAASQQGQLVAVIRTSRAYSSIIPEVRDVLRRMLPTSAAQIRTMEDRIAGTAADRRFAMLAITAFAVIALLLAAIGIYGVVWYTVATRVHEIGIRMALGATTRSVLIEMVRGTFASAAAGVLAGAVLGFILGRFTQTILYGVSREDPINYAASAGLVIAAVVFGSLVPARRAAAVDPLVAIRADA